MKHRHFSLLAMLMLAAGAAQAELDPTNRALTLAADLPAGALKDQLLSCASGPFYPTEFAIAHRGAPLGYLSTVARVMSQPPTWAQVLLSATLPLLKT